MMTIITFLFTLMICQGWCQDLTITNSGTSMIQTSSDSTRIIELDAYWAELSRTVREGDYEGYAAAYHEDAVVVFATSENKISLPINKALADWKQGFLDSKNGVQEDSVTFRFSQRIGNASSAHETGMFHFIRKDKEGTITASSYIHFEMLFVKKDDLWLATMEYQKSVGTQAQWEALK